MNPYFIGLMLFLSLTSCHDVKKQKQLQQINDMIQTVDSIAQTRNTIHADSVSLMLSEIAVVRQSIQDNYDSDTITMEFAQELEDYKLAWHALKKVQQNNLLLETGIREEQKALAELQKDIQSGNGNRAKYDNYIRFEKNKVAQIRVLLSGTIQNKNTGTTIYHQLHDDMKAYNEQLLLKKPAL